MNYGKRLLSGFLALVLTVGMIPAPALASEAETTEPTVQETTQPSEVPAKTAVPTESAAPETEATVPSSAVETTPAVTEETVPAATEETLPVTTEETVPVTTEETVPETTEETVPETTEEVLLEGLLSQEQIDAILGRDDHIWLFPLAPEFYGKIRSWCGSVPDDACAFCGTVHGCSLNHLTEAGQWGLEIAVPAGTPVYAPGPGVLYKNGSTILLEHDIGRELSYYTLLYHVSGSDLANGTDVDTGDIIAATGSNAQGEAVLGYAMFLAPAGQGESYASDIKMTEGIMAGCGWVEAWGQMGMLNNNPSQQSTAAPAEKDIAITPELMIHPGTVGYTFDPAEVTVFLPEAPEEEQQNEADTPSQDAALVIPDTDYSLYPDLDPSIPLVQQGAISRNLYYKLFRDGTVIIDGPSKNGAMTPHYHETPAPWGKAVTRVILGSGVSIIGRSAFEGCTQLKSIIFSKNVRGIYEDCFSGCTALESVYIPETMRELRDNAFKDCTGLKRVDIDSVTAWMNMAIFSDTANPLTYAHHLYEKGQLVTDVIVPETNYFDVANFAFYNCVDLKSVTLPKNVRFPMSAVSCREADPNHVVDLYVPDLETWYNKVISDSANMYDYSWARYRLFVGGKPFTELQVPESVTEIRGHCFDGCESLQKVIMPSHVTSYAVSVFKNCTNLTTAVIFAPYMNNAGFLFDGCTSLTDVKLTGPWDTIYRNMFARCVSLKHVNIPEGVRTIGDQAFYECTSLTSISLPESAGWLNTECFARSGLYSIVTPKLVSRSPRIFAECPNLKRVTLSGIYGPGPRCFEGSENLESVRLYVDIPDDPYSTGLYVTECQDDSFEGTPSLKTIYWSCGKKEWEQHYDKRLYIFHGAQHVFDVRSDPYLEDFELKEWSFTIRKNTNLPEEAEKNYVLAEDASITTGYSLGTDGTKNPRTYPVLPDDPGKVIINVDAFGDTFTISGGPEYRTWSIPADYVHNGQTFDLEKVSASPVFNAFMVDGINVLNSDWKDIALSGNLETVIPMVDWGTDQDPAGRKIILTQTPVDEKGNPGATVRLPLQEGETKIDLGKTFRMDQPIILQAITSSGLKDVRTLTPRLDLNFPLNGYSLKMSKACGQTIPESVPFLGGMYMGMNTGVSVPMEMTIRDGKFYAAIGMSFVNDPDVSDSVETSDERATKIMDFAEQAESLLNGSAAQDLQDKVDEIQSAYEDWDSYIAKTNGRVGLDANLSFMGYAEGTFEGGRVTITSSGCLIKADMSAEWKYLFTLGQVPVYVRTEIGGDLSADFNLLISEQAKEFAPQMTLKQGFSIEGAAGVGLPDLIGAEVVMGIDAHMLWETGITRNHIKMDADIEGSINAYVLDHELIGNDQDVPDADIPGLVLGRENYILFEKDMPVQNDLKPTEKSLATAEDPALNSAGPRLPVELNCSSFAKVDLSYMEDSSFMGTASASSRALGSQKANAPFVSNAFRNAAPQTATLPDGTIIATWTGLVPGKTGSNALNVLYSVYKNGSWTAPQPVENDGTQDGQHTLKFIYDSIFVVFQDASSPVPANADLQTAGSYMGITAGYYDPAAGKFICKPVCTGGGVNMLPRICGGKSGAYAVWVRNSASDWFGITGTNSILYSSFSPSAWGPVKTAYSGLGPIQSMDVVYSGYNPLHIGYSEDMDRDIGTVSDTEVFIDGQRMSQDGTPDTGLVALGDEFYWNANGRLMVDGLKATADTVLLPSDRFEMVSLNGNNALIYEQCNGYASDLYVCYGTRDSWGSPMLLMSSPNKISSFAPCVMPEGGFNLLMLQRGVSSDAGTGVNPYTTASLNWFSSVPLYTNLTLQKVRYDPKDYSAAKDFPVTLEVQNNGGITVNRFTIKFLNENGEELSSTDYTTPILPGKTAVIKTKLAIYSETQDRVITARLEMPWNVTEKDETDNEFRIVLKNYDLGVENLSWDKTMNGTVTIHADIANYGIAEETDVHYELRKDRPDGMLMMSGVIPSIEAHGIAPVSFRNLPTSTCTYYVCVQPKADDINRGNNYDFTFVHGLPFSIAAANMTLGSTLTMHFYVNNADLKPNETYTAKITRSYADGRPDSVVTIPQARWQPFGKSMMRFSYENLAAKEMCDTLKIQILKADGSAASTIKMDSIRDYCMRNFDRQKAMVKSMMADMLNYGAEAQKQFNYNTADLANSRMTPAQQAFATNDPAMKDHRVSGANYAGSTLKLESRLMMDLYFKNVTSDQYAVLSYVDHSGKTHNKKIPYASMKPNGKYRIITVDDMVIADCRQLITCKLYNAKGREVASVADSPESYCARMANKGSLYSSVIKFSTSAHYYFHNR